MLSNEQLQGLMFSLKEISRDGLRYTLNEKLCKRDSISTTDIYSIATGLYHLVEQMSQQPMQDMTSTAYVDRFFRSVRRKRENIALGKKDLIELVRMEDDEPMKDCSDDAFMIVGFVWYPKNKLALENYFEDILTRAHNFDTRADTQMFKLPDLHADVRKRISSRSYGRDRR